MHHMQREEATCPFAILFGLCGGALVLCLAAIWFILWMR